ncbi:MAG: 3-deoxy-7-phosphoheptulonate synthase [Candidatus Peregrinibacteria bacterium Greene0416_19]|nr:MAG: 3-deoxy-7-phosphoheptulonate synthase [Candidatus Peregrinibacteria bacterium Greene0416_19]
MKTLILDNYDSFTYNLYQYIGELGGNPVVHRNDTIDLDGVRELSITHIIISPGAGNPYTPKDIGIAEELIDYAAAHGIPLLGVCLGHQVLGKHFGATVSRAPTPYHGKASHVKIEGKSPLFDGVGEDSDVMRYHSLHVEEKTLPTTLKVTARSTEDGLIMAMEDTKKMLFGVQFHPESIGTPSGKRILRNFLSIEGSAKSHTHSIVLGRESERKSTLLASRETREHTEIVIRPGCVIGSKKQTVIIAGPCSMESEMQVEEAAAMVKEHGLHIMRGGAFKPRTGPYHFQGLGEQGLKMLKKAAEKHGLATISEAMCPEQVALVNEYCDIIQVGARNMQNYDLLRALGKTRKPVLLKRGLAATLKELLLAAEYILAGGNEQVILCERGIRTFEEEVRFTLCLGSIPPLRKLTHLPIMVDPSHAAGVSEYVPDYARSAVAMGCDGLIMEVHPHPEEALSDGKQSLSPREMKVCMDGVRAIATAMGKQIT